MFSIPMPWRDSSLQFTLPGEGYSTFMQFVVVVFAMLGCLLPVALVLWLYWYETRLVSRLAAAGLLSLRLGALILLLFLLFLQPIYGHDVTTGLPGRVVIAVDRSDSMDIADPQRPNVEKLRVARALKLAEGVATEEQYLRWIKDYDDKKSPQWTSGEDHSAHDKVCALVDEVTRTKMAKAVLAKEGMGLVPRLADKHHVTLLGFNRDIWDLKPEQLEQLFAAPNAPDNNDANAINAGSYTDIRLALARAQELAGGDDRELLGIVLLTDGQHNIGESPVKKAIELGERQIPIFPIALGARQPPPDVALVAIKAPNNVFKEVDAPIEVRFKVTGLPAQYFKVELRLEGAEKKVLEERNIYHEGKDREYVERFPVRLDKAGTQTLVATVKPSNPATKETTTANNSRAVAINVADEKAKVLVIDGEARWEWHYLATALQRDRTMQVQNVVFQQPRLNKDLTPDELKKIGSPAQKLPEGPDALADFDCIILGDVEAAQLPLVERQRIEKYVADRGGTLVLLAGKRAMPLGFPEGDAAGEADPLRKMLPIEDPRIVDPKEGFSVTLTSEGKETEFLKLDSDNAKSDARWSELPKHYWGVVGKVKPGARALAFVPGPVAEKLGDKPGKNKPEEMNGLIVRHNYGFGRVLFVGIDSTWRWRYKVGDTHHHRFWGQTIRWAAADKPLITGNEHVRFGTPQPTYRQGQETEIVARLSEELGSLKTDMVAGARIIRKDPRTQKEEAVALVPLLRREAQPRVLEGKVRDLQAGSYEIELVIPDLADKLKPAGLTPDGKNETMRSPFTVLPPDTMEMIDLETKWPLLEELASKTGGKVFTPDEADQLRELLILRSKPHTDHYAQRLWEWWVLLVLIVGLLTVEWVARKFAGLP
jgi:hypothetical protein